MSPNCHLLAQSIPNKFICNELVSVADGGMQQSMNCVEDSVSPTMGHFGPWVSQINVTNECDVTKDISNLEAGRVCPVVQCMLVPLLG